MLHLGDRVVDIGDRDDPHADQAVGRDRAIFLAEPVVVAADDRLVDLVMRDVAPEDRPRDHRREQDLGVHAVLVLLADALLGPPVPAASATLRPNGCQVPSARPARRSRKLASSSGWPSIISASPPSGRCTVCGARSRYFSGTRWIHRSGGTSRCPSADIRLYCLAISPPSVIPEAAPQPSPLPGKRGEGVTPQINGPRAASGIGRGPRSERVRDSRLRSFILHQCAGAWAILETLAIAGAQFSFLAAWSSR